MLLVTWIGLAATTTSVALLTSVIRRTHPRVIHGLGGVLSLALGVCLAAGSLQAVAQDSPSPMDRPPAPAIAGPSQQDSPPKPAPIEIQEIESEAPLSAATEDEPAARDASSTTEAPSAPEAFAPAPPQPERSEPAGVQDAATLPESEDVAEAIAEAVSTTGDRTVEATNAEQARPDAESVASNNEGPRQAEAYPTRDSAQPHKLSGPLLDDLQLPKNRPAWVYGKTEQRDGATWIPVSGAPESDDLAASQALDEQLLDEVAKFARRHLGREDASRFIDFTPGEVRSLFVAEELIDHPRYGDNVLSEAHALLKMDNDARNAIAARWEEAVARSRLMQVALAGGAAILLLSMTAGYFRVDAATKGYYSGRLQVAMAAAILATVAGGVLLANQRELWDWIL